MVDWVSIILSIIAVVVIITWIIIQYNKAFAKIVKSNTWPPNVNVCPDYWEKIPTGKCKNIKKLGSCNLDDEGKDLSKMTKDQKCNWAKSCEVTWDGLCG